MNEKQNSWYFIGLYCNQSAARESLLRFHNEDKGDA